MNSLRTILIAEDNANDAELTLAALCQENLANRIEIVRDGVEVMEYLRCEGEYEHRKNEVPAVILLDIKMPRMNGIEVLEAIRTDPKLKAIPVVMLTSSREDLDVYNCHRLGVNAYVVKPVGFKEFIDAVRKVGVFWGLLNEFPR